MDYENHICNQLDFLYGPQGEQVWLEIKGIIDRFLKNNNDLSSERFQLTEKDAILITYGDQFQSPNQSPFFLRLLDIVLVIG